MAQVKWRTRKPGHSEETMTLEFWAKTTSDDQPGISVFEHMVNVGCVARCLAELCPHLLRQFQLGVSEVGALAALHDLGKISPGFQQKCAAWLGTNHLTEIAQRWTWDTTMEPDHGKVTHTAVQTFLVNSGTNRRTAKFLSAILGGHHGRLNPPNDRGFQPVKATLTENRLNQVVGTVIRTRTRQICLVFSS